MIQAKMSRKTAATLCLAPLVLFALAASAGGEPAGMTIEISQAVRDYMEAIDAGDLDRQMGFWSQDTNVTSIIMGEIWTGPANIRARSAEYVPVSKIMLCELGEVKVTSLGVDTALAILPYHPIRRDPIDERLRPFELESMLTLVWKRTPQGWRIIHEHVSVKVPPPAAK